MGQVRRLQRQEARHQTTMRRLDAAGRTAREQGTSGVCDCTCSLLSCVAEPARVPSTGTPVTFVLSHGRQSGPYKEKKVATGTGRSWAVCRTDRTAGPHRLNALATAPVTVSHRRAGGIIGGKMKKDKPMGDETREFLEQHFPDASDLGKSKVLAEPDWHQGGTDRSVRVNCGSNPLRWLVNTGNSEIWAI